MIQHECQPIDVYCCHVSLCPVNRGDSCLYFGWGTLPFVPLDAAHPIQYAAKKAGLSFMADTSRCHKFHFPFVPRYKKHIVQLPLKFTWCCVTEFGHGKWAEVRFVISTPGDKTPCEILLTVSHPGDEKMKEVRVAEPLLGVQLSRPHLTPV